MTKKTIEKTATTFALLLIASGMLAFAPGEARAGAPACNPPAGAGSGRPLQWCYKYGDQTLYKEKPQTCPGKQPVPDQPTGQAIIPPFGRGFKTDSRPPRTGGGNSESASRQRSATLLSVVILVGGLALVAFSLQQLLRRATAQSSLARRRPVQTWKILLRPRAAVAFACAVAVCGLAPSLWLLTRGTPAAASPLAANKRRELINTLQAQQGTPEFTSALQVGSFGLTQIGGTASDGQGNTYVAGAFYGRMIFNTPSQPTQLDSTENYDVFIAKYDAAGNPLWARMANGATGLIITDPDTNEQEHFSIDGALALAIDAQGNAYVGGGFVKSLFFKDAGGNTVATLGDDAEAESDEINFELFVAKYDAGGTLQWAQGGQSGSLDDAEAETDLDSGINGITDIVLDSLGNPYVAGTFTGNNFLGQEIVTEGVRDVLLSRLSPATGAPVWVSTPGSTGIDGAMGLGIDNSSNVYIIGDMGGTITFPTAPQPTTLELEDGFGDAFIAKYNQDGQVLYAKQIGGTQPIDGTHIAVTGAGELYLTGAFEGSAEFDSITVTDPSAGSGASGFLTKYDAAGSAVWARIYGRTAGESSDGDVIGYRVTVDASGSPYLTGIFEGAATFGTETPATTQTLTSDRLQDQFVAHYDAAGNFRWVKQPLRGGTDSSFSIGSEDAPVEVLPARLVYNNATKALVLTGDFQGTATFDAITLNSGAERHGYIAAITPPHPLVISEFRFRGPDPDGAGTQTGARDEYVELYNQSNSEVDLGGWALAALDPNGTPSVVFNFPTLASIPPRGHFLLGGADYSLGVTPDGTLNFDIPDGSGIALFYVGTTLNAGTLVDAAGFSSVTDTLYREGAGLSPAGGITEDGQHSFVRRLNTGTPQDTGNNENDFLFISTDAAIYNARVSALGAPGPESTASHVQRNAQVKASLVDPQCAGFGAANSACARVRAGGSFPNAAYGTLAIRRKFTNTTGAPVTALRFRVVDITTNNSPGYVSSHAILRVLNSGGASVNGGAVQITGATLEPSPAQPNGGGYNSALEVALPGGSLADGDSINVEFLLGVEQNGGFRFYVNVEAVPGVASASAGSPSNRKTGGTKATGSRQMK